jgi:glycosyltransferase involved in cell wall biosynthesis
VAVEAEVDEGAGEAAAGVGARCCVVTIPAVTQVVHTYNHERFVDLCLDSVAKQTFDDFELVIVDDCSTDRTVERIKTWLRDSPVKARLVVNERNLGLCASRNISLRHARGELLSSVSGDDYYEPDKIERQYRFWQTLDGSVAAVFSNMQLRDEQGREIGAAYPSGVPPAEGRIFDRLIQGNFIAAPTVMARRLALEEAGGYDESLAYEDYDMWLRLADRYAFRFLPGLLVNYRVLPTSLSRNPARAAAMDESRARLLLKWLGRDRRTDAVVLRRAWRNGLRVLAADRRRGRRVLQDVRAARPSLGRRVGVATFAVPGAGHALAAAFAATDPLRR